MTKTNKAFSVIKHYRLSSIMMVILLAVVEAFFVYKLINAPFGNDVRIDTDRMEDLYWTISYYEENCIDCPKKWKVEAELPVPFIFENPDTVELKLVKEQVFHVVENYKNDFDLVLRLMDYIHDKTEYAKSDGVYSSYFVLIKSVFQGGRFWCGSMSKAMMTACLSLGRNARLIHFQTAPDGDQRYIGHYAVEIWLPEMSKWALFDPTINIYYLHKGQPASAMEIHNAYVNDKTGEINVVKAEKLFNLETFNDKKFLPEVSLKNYFKHFQVIFRNDFLENGDIVHTTNRETKNYYVNWVDEKTPAFYFKQEFPALSVRIGVLLLNGIIIVFLLVGLSVNRNK